MQRHFFFAFQKDSKYTDLVVTPLLKVNADLWLIFNWFQQYPKFFTAGFFSHEGPTREQVIRNVLYYFCFAAVLQSRNCSIRIDSSILFITLCFVFCISFSDGRVFIFFHLPWSWIQWSCCAIRVILPCMLSHKIMRPQWPPELIIHSMSDSEGNSRFFFPESPYVSRDEVEGNIRTRGKTKPTGFPRDLTLSVLLYF